MHLCRDVDWGSAPQWVSAVAALLAVALSGIGVFVATRTFKRSVRDAHVAQARRIHTVHSEQRVNAGQIVDAKEGYAEQGVLSDRVDRTNRDLGFNTVAHAQVVKVTVHNNSDEIISNVAVQVRTKTVDWYPPNAGYVIQAVVPGTTYVVDFVTLDQSTDGFIGQVLTFQVDITFTDSVGNHWRRTDAQPVEEIADNPYRAPFGPELITLGRDDPFSG